jgi:hypothetical protein
MVKVQSNDDMSVEQLETEMSAAHDRYVAAKRISREAKLAAKIAKKEWKGVRKRLRVAQDEAEARVNERGKKSAAQEPLQEKKPQTPALGARVASSPEVSRRPPKARKKPAEPVDAAPVVEVKSADGS